MILAIITVQKTILKTLFFGGVCDMDNLLRDRINLIPSFLDYSLTSSRFAHKRPFLKVRRLFFIN